MLLNVSDRKYTAFDVIGHLFQFCWIPLGVKNGAAVFQRALDKIIEKENLCSAFPYIGDITITGHTQSERDLNKKKFLRGYHKGNKSKFITSVRSVNILGYHISGGIIKPDPERLRSLKNLSSLENSKSAKNAMVSLCFMRNGYITFLTRFNH